MEISISNPRVSYMSLFVSSHLLHGNIENSLEAPFVSGSSQSVSDALPGWKQGRGEGL